MTKIVCVGDTHFQAGHWRNQDRIASMEQIVTEGLATDSLGGWIHLGDMWHEKASEDDLNTVAEFLQRMAAVAPVVLLMGNHGSAGYTLLMRRLKADWPIYVLDTPQVIGVPLAAGGGTLQFAAIPYPQKSVLVAAGVAPNDIKAAAEQALDIICMDLAARLQQVAGPKMLIGHATIAGSTASTGQPMGIEHDIAVTATMLARFGDMPKIFAHIHEPQDIYGATYAGSIAPTDWGETTARRYLVVEFWQEEQAAWMHRIVSKPIRTARLFHVDGLLTRDSFTWRCTKGPDGAVDSPPRVRRILAATATSLDVRRNGTATLAYDVEREDTVVDWTDCDVRVRARYAEQERDVLTTAKERVRKEFAGARRFEFEPIAVHARELRAPEVIAAKTFQEKLAAWARLSGVAWSDEIQRCAEALQSESVDAVGDVEVRMAQLLDAEQEEVTA